MHTSIFSTLHCILPRRRRRLQSSLGGRQQKPISRYESRVRIELEPEPRFIELLDIKIPSRGDGFVDEKVPKHREHRLPVGRVGEVLLEGRVRLRDDEMVAVRPARVRHDGDVVGGRHGGDALQFRHAARPHDVRLEDVDVAALDEPAEAVARVLVLAGGELGGRVGALELGEAVRVVGREAFFPPVDAEGGAGRDELDGVRHVEAHVAVDAEREGGADALAVEPEESHVLAQAGLAFIGAVGEGDLGSGEAHLLRCGGFGAGAVEVEALAGVAAEEAVDGLAV